MPYHAEIEVVLGLAPDKWKRTIKATDFEQTIIVNGNSRFEKDSADYLPKWLNDVVAALFEVVPPETIDEIGKLDEEIPLPDGKPGEWNVSYSPTSTDGKTTVSWGGRVVFDRRTGVINRIFAKGFSADFTFYESFHDQQVARNIETFPPAPRGDITTRITELGDLDSPDESMFEISRPTPPEEQLRMVQIPEAEYRKLAIDPPVLKWPPVKVRPTSGSLATYIVTDRTGSVREARFIISNNMSIADGAVELVKTLKFKPLVVDSVPVQVETTLTFNFDTTIKGDQANFQAASYYFKRGRDLTYPRTDGSSPFHMKGKFEGEGIFAGLSGSYEEWWLAPNRWRRQVTIAENTFVETRIDDDHYKQAISPGVVKVVDRVTSLFTGEFPGYAYYSPDTDWHMADVDFENIPMTRVAMGRVDDGKVTWSPGYYFDHDGKVRARNSGPETITYDEFTAFAGKQVPYRIDSKFNDILALTARIDSLEPVSPEPDSFFELKGVRHSDWLRPSPW